MSAYLLIDAHVTDEARYAEYRQWSSRAMQEHGAEVLVRGGPVTVLEGAWQPSRIVVLKFPSREAAEGFYRSATYQQGRLLRQGAADVKMIIVEGFVPA